MRLHRFYITEPVGTRKELSIESEELVNQVRRVFRLRTGDHVVLFDGSGSDFECEIVAGEHINKSDKKVVTFRTISSGRSRYMPPRRLYLCASLVKKDNFEFIVEKATELGVTDIIPVMAERSEKKSLNDARLKKIAVEASEQSGRGTVPTIWPIVSMELVLSLLKKGPGPELMPFQDRSLKREWISPRTISFHTEGEKFDSEETSTDESLAVFIGPEGGWSPSELDMFHKDGIAVRSLGDQVLRAETAVISALSQVVF